MNEAVIPSPTYLRTITSSNACQTIDTIRVIEQAVITYLDSPPSQVMNSTQWGMTTDTKAGLSSLLPFENLLHVINSYLLRAVSLEPSLLDFYSKHNSQLDTSSVFQLSFILADSTIHLQSYHLIPLPHLLTSRFFLS